MTDRKQTSLDSLYRNRRQRHPAPASLHQTMHAKLSAKTTRRPRWVAVAPVMASLILVFLVLRPSLETTSVLTQADFETVADSSLAAPVAPAPAARQLSKSTSEAPMGDYEAFSADSIVADEIVVMAEPAVPALEEQNLAPLRPEQAVNGLNLKIIDSQQGIAIDCQGEAVMADVLKGRPDDQWLELTWRDDDWKVNALQASPCSSETTTDADR
ncbi:hypothetical protein [Reinekea blandensis]|uniref:RNA polymerase sigma-70 factor n=1 Tax=Reinekea blandensis MED297 TaxID=314283 RepID=A4BJU5_9GAMM|nr:hypothetical protein [Reinekea blandensis]EAR07612.1 RNA polymerase sigma-70 factor [Reinekea sp. MED297] [Reinekea blandensis MED297]